MPENDMHTTAKDQRSPWFHAALIGAVSACLMPLQAHSQWAPGGVPVCRFGGNQESPRAVPDGQGGAYVVWRDERNDATGVNADIYIQRITSSGTIADGWPLNGLPVCDELHGQSEAVLAPDGMGGVILAWMDGRNFHWDIYALRLTGVGKTALGWSEDGVPVCRALDDQLFPTLAPDGSGGAIIAWEDYRNGDSDNMVGGQVFALRLSANGQVAEGWVPDGTLVGSSPTSQFGPKVEADGLGGAIIAWSDEDIHAQRLTAGGTVAEGWPNSGVTLCAAVRRQEFLAICSNGAGGAFVIWEDTRRWSGLGARFPSYDLYGSHVTSGGTIAQGWPGDGLALSDATSAQFDHSLAPDGTGGLVVAWVDYRNSEAMIYAHRVTAAGTPAPGWIEDGRLVSDAINLEFTPRVASENVGGMYVAFEEFDPSTSFGWVRVQHMSSQGQVALGWDPAGVRVAGTSGQGHPTIVASELGAIACWNDSRNVGIRLDIYAQRFIGDGPVPVLVSLVEARAEPGRVRVTWHSADVHSVMVERRTMDSAWEAIATLVSDAGGMLYLDDRAVNAGQSYGYRLRFDLAGEETVVGETWVEVPSAPSLTLDPPRPNPTRGELAVTYSLGSAASASLELLDMGGRRVFQREVGLRGPGRQVQRLPETSTLAPGVYWLRLHQDGQVRTTRAVKVN